jgi:hypothetical protein
MRRVRRQWPEERAFPVVPDAGALDVGQHRPSGIEQDLPPRFSVTCR